MAKLVDAPGLGPDAVKACRFESDLLHQIREAVNVKVHSLFAFFFELQSERLLIPQRLEGMDPSAWHPKPLEVELKPIEEKAENPPIPDLLSKAHT